MVRARDLVRIRLATIDLSWRRVGVWDVEAMRPWQMIDACVVRVHHYIIATRL